MDPVADQGAAAMSSPHSLRQRVDNAIDSLQRTWGHLDLQFLNGGVNFKQCEPIVAALEKCASDVVALVTPTNRPRHPSNIERITSLSDALESIARKYGGILCKSDALHSLVAEHAPADAREYWSGNREGEIFGWIRQQAEVVDVLAPRGILVWTNEADRRVRIVNTNWLTAHADIRRFVMERWHGRRCRFCRIDEIPTSLELKPLDPQKRNGVAFVNGVMQLQVGAGSLARALHAVLEVLACDCRELRKSGGCGGSGSGSGACDGCGAGST